VVRSRQATIAAAKFDLSFVRLKCMAYVRSNRARKNGITLGRVPPWVGRPSHPKGDAMPAGRFCAVAIPVPPRFSTLAG
jgi:hypothetical protein